MLLLRRIAREVLPRSWKSKLTTWYDKRVQFTVSAGWDSHARNSRFGVGAVKDEHFGDQWTEPWKFGVDVPAEEFLTYLDEKMTAPFFGVGGTVLEIGAGGGRMTQFLLRRCDRVIAADTSGTLIRLMRKRFGAEPKLEYMQLDARGLSQVPDRSLDKVFSYDVFVHFEPWDIFNYLCEIRRTLKPGGQALIHHSNTFSELGWPKFLSDVEINVGRNKKFDSFGVMTPEMMRELAVRAGLEVVEQRDDIVPRDSVIYLRAPQ